jgi:hypothetical protein
MHAQGFTGGGQYDVQREAVVALSNALASASLVAAVARYEHTTHAALGSEVMRVNMRTGVTFDNYDVKFIFSVIS